MTNVEHRHDMSVSDAARRGVAGLVSDAEGGTDIVVTRRNQPIAAVVSMQRLAEVEDLVADLTDLALVLARQATDSGHRTGMDDVLDAFGYTRDDLEELDDA